MKIESVNKTEFNIALHCVLSSDYLRDYIELHNPKLIKSEVHQAVLDICINHWGEFRKAPSASFIDIVESEYDANAIEPAEYDLLVGFDKLIKYDTEVDVAYQIKEAEKYLTEKYNELFVERLKDTDDNEYEGELNKYVPPTIEDTPGILPFQDEDAIREAGKVIEKRQLIKFPGVLGHLLNRHFVSAAFVCFFAPAKRGKSWFLGETARRALYSGRSTWFISISDMLQDEVISRFGHMASGLPVHKEDVGTHYTPVLDCILNQTNECTDPCDCMVTSDAKNGIKLSPKDEPDYKVCEDHCDKFKGATWYEELELEKTLDQEELVKSWRKFKKRTKNKKFRIFTANAGEFGVHTLDKWYDQQEKDPDIDWLPETIIIDYLDLAEDDQKHFDDRSRLNKVFMKTNAFAKKHDILVVTASQTNAEGLTVELVTEENFSGDKRKLDHITAAIGLNQTPNEKEEGIMRLNVFMGRHAPFNKVHCVKVIQDLKIGKVIKTSFY